LKILLKQDIDRVGRMGEVVDVPGGYARNFLIPRNLAVGVTRGRIKEIEEQQKVLGVKAARQREQVEETADGIRSRRIVLKARCSASGKLFGSITNRQLASEITEQTGEEIDRHKITIDERIRTVGSHHASIRLHPDVVLDLEFEVEGEGFVAEEPDEEPEAPRDAETEVPLKADAEQAGLDAAASETSPQAEADEEELNADRTADADRAELNADRTAEEVDYTQATQTADSDSSPDATD
jgi:large subunit ribosomal protein L9